MTGENPIGIVEMPEDEFPFALLVFDNEDRLGTMTIVRGPGVMYTPQLPEDGQPWRVLTVKLREDFFQ